jgi:hypothetical protein
MTEFRVFNDPEADWADAFGRRNNTQKTKAALRRTRWREIQWVDFEMMRGGFSISVELF